MDSDKDRLPPYSAISGSHERPWLCGRRLQHRPRKLRSAVVACLVFIVYAQWRQIYAASISSHDSDYTVQGLSVSRLQDDLTTCTKLHNKPVDPVGLGREKNARFVDGHRPTLIRNATVWTGEPTGETTAEDTWAGKGYTWIRADVFIEDGLIKKVEGDLRQGDLPSNVLVYDARGRPLTSGIIDMHSHVGVHGLPTLHGNEDVSELSSDITPYVRSMDGIQPTDHQIQVIKSGGVTTSLVLPGSSNNIGGEAFVIKHAVGREDGRNETSVADMLADPDRTWRYMKMACGENAKHVHGKVGERGPLSRLGESWEFRRAFEKASKLLREQDDWCHAANLGLGNVRTYLPFEIEWEALIAVLRGQAQVHTHCYTIPDLEAFVDHSNEFQFPVRAFHHAHQTYLVPEILKRAWGDSPPASALFADNMWYKAEAYIGSEYAGKRLHDSGLVPIYVSDNPVLNAQHVVFEAAKAYRYGLPYHAALASVTSGPAERLGLGQRLGKVMAGFDADVVVWDSDPLSVGARPVQVWIDGTAQYDHPAELNKSFIGHIVPDTRLSKVIEDPITRSDDVVFTGVSRILLPAAAGFPVPIGEAVNVAISQGNITCIGECASQLKAASQNPGSIFHLDNGYLTPSFTAFGSTIGLNEVESERDTDNGVDRNTFSRAIDGLALDTKKLQVAHRYGVTRAISAPKFTGIGTHHGTSAGFLTGASMSIAPEAVFGPDVAVHYTLDRSAKRDADGTPSMSAAVGDLRQKLLSAVDSTDFLKSQPRRNSEENSEASFLQKVITGVTPLAITVHSADTISALLRVKAEVDDAISRTKASSSDLRLVLVGAAEAHLLANELALAKVGVILAPLQSYAVSWDQRRALPGAPLTNNTAIDVLIDAGVVTAIGLEEDWLVRDLALLAGTAYHDSEGRLSEREALGLVSANIHDLLGLEHLKHQQQHFLVFEGSPFDIGSRIKAISEGNEKLHIF